MFAFKPPYRLRDKKSLLSLLKKHDLKGFGGIMLDDIRESLPRADKYIRALGDEVSLVTRTDNRIVVFYNDRSCQIDIDDSFVRLWRSVAVDNVDEKKISEYLDTQGIRHMADQGPKVIRPLKRRALKRKRLFKKPRDNEHMGNILVNYENY